MVRSSTRVKGGVYRSLDGGRTWSFAPVGFGGSSILIDPGNPAVLYSAGGPGVVRSDDGGATWTTGVSGPTQTGVTALAVAPSVPGTLYAGTQYRFGGGLFKTTDGARNWSSLPIGVAVESIAVDPSMIPQTSISEPAPMACGRASMRV